MRFIDNGPSIPDDLLIARDAGQVLFFCGAGVSFAEARLPDFSVLSERVLNLLGSATDSPARQLFNAARTPDKPCGVSGSVAFDRIFGMLEREFEAAEVREAVAIALRPQPGYGLGAHRTLLDLSRTRGGMPRIVTTNFDLLFEECEPEIASSNPPRLPDPSRDNDFHGIIHLHGRVDAEYGGACDDEFVLSSADFGHAYLSDGWATRYIQALLQRFRIVFVGYSADDPPVQYLLEALSRFRRPGHALYAFHSGNKSEAAQQWAHKGVEPISYDGASNHAALWDTLSAWAERARDVDGWHDHLIQRAMQGPASMATHERGMVAHLAASTVGSRLIAFSENTLPAEWLFVFDRNARYGQANTIGCDDSNDRFDPFDAFGLDSDPLPDPVDPENIHARRSVPESVWDGMAVTPADRERLPLAATALFRSGAGQVPALPSRLENLGWWIRRIAHQPAALWWAAGQTPLHPKIQRDIETSLHHEAKRYSPVVRAGWRFLLRCWQQTLRTPDLDRYAIEQTSKVDGWSTSLVRDAMALYQPLLAVKPSYSNKAPEPHPEIALRDILRVDVEYPRPPESFDIPSDLLSYAVRLFRQQLEDAVQYESELDCLDHIYLDSIRADADAGVTLDEHYHGITGHVITFTNMVARLAAIDYESARREVSRWSAEDPVFTRLRIWACGRTDLTTPEEAGRIFVALDDESFWSFAQERDLLFALRDRWNEISPSTIDSLEERLRHGRFPFGEHHQDRKRLVAHHRLDRIQWLSTQGVKFSFDEETEISSLLLLAPDWTEESIRNTARPMLSQARDIVTDNSSAPLEHLPLGEVLERAQELGKYQFDVLTMRQHFHGLAADRPSRALSVLTDATRRGKFVPWAWSVLLHSRSGSTKTSRLLSTIGHRVARLQSEQLLEIVNPAAEWLHARSEQLYSECPEVLDVAWDAVVRALMTEPESQRLHRSDRRWVDKSMGSAVGRMLDAWFKHPSVKDATPDTGLPAGWLGRLDQMLGLPGDHKQHAVVMIASRLNWLFHVVPEWASDRILPLAPRSDDNNKAFWAGYFWSGKIPQPALYSRLKPVFIALARQTELRSEQANSVARILLSGWGYGDGTAESEERVSDVELREILIYAGDDLRATMLWHLQQWAHIPESPFPIRLVPFLERVWPRQKALRTKRMSGKLVDLALSIPYRFAEIVPLILPRLVPINGQSVVISHTNIPASIFETFPRSLLDLLSVILGEDAREWPYGTGNILYQLTEQPATRGDPRLSKLLRFEQRRQF
jgi:hypothetical protein